MHFNQGFFGKTAAVARSNFSAEASNQAHQENSAQKGQWHWRWGGRFLRHLQGWTTNTHTHAPAFRSHSQKAAGQISPEFWSIHCRESMCAFKILQICWSWAEREGASQLWHCINTKRSQRQVCPCTASLSQQPLCQGSLCSSPAALLLLTSKKSA